MIWVVVAVLVIGLAIGIASTVRLVGWPAKTSDDEITNRAIVTLTGTVRIVGEPLISPLSARSCVFYETYANLYEWPKDDDIEKVPDQSKRVLAAQLAKKQMIPFELVTTVGVVFVDGVEADIELQPTPVFPRYPEREAKFLREHDRDERLIENATFEEITVDPDELISVHGVAIIEAPNKIRLVANGDDPIVIGVPRKTASSVT
jgi:hypothetical protein